MLVSALRHTTNNIFMVRPANFGFNPETAETNAFQINDQKLTSKEISQAAVIEFDMFVEKLRLVGVNVIVGEEPREPIKTDSVFPNNWVTFHQSGRVITYPMFSKTRRLERSEDFLKQIGEQFHIEQRIHFEEYEKKNQYLEGTGSMIFDHSNRSVLACVSPRTDKALLNEFSKRFSYKTIIFKAVDENDQDIYHTNVMMALGESFVVICLGTIKKVEDLNRLKSYFARVGKEVIEISISQMNAFAGNMLQVRNNKDETFLVMSSQAYHSLSKHQISRIQAHTKILHSPIPIIETYGGGSARCMMAEIFLKEKNALHI